MLLLKYYIVNKKLNTITVGQPNTQIKYHIASINHHVETLKTSCVCFLSTWMFSIY